MEKYCIYEAESGHIIQTYNNKREAKKEAIKLTKLTGESIHHGRSGKQ